MSRRIWMGGDLPAIHRDGHEYFLLSVDEALFLVRNQCPHRGGPLKFGYINSAEALVCPQHGNCYPIDRLVEQASTLRLNCVPAKSPPNSPSPLP